MIKKGIILAGGTGSRMSPLTKAVNKQLLPIHDKPLIFYPLSVLMLSGIRDVLIIVNKGQLNQFKKILPNGNNLGIKISYAEQKNPKGLPDAFLVGKKFIGNENVALILGDNFFYGQSLTKILKKCVKLKVGATVILHPVKNPSLYGVANIDKKNKITKIIEKPKKKISNLAVTGFYFFDNKVINYSKNLKPSKRKEIEIVDLLNKYKKKGKLSAEFLGGVQYYFIPFNVFYAIIKTIFFAFIISSVSAYFGYHTKGGAIAVGKSNTQAVVSSSILILLFNYVLTDLLLS